MRKIFAGFIVFLFIFNIFMSASYADAINNIKFIAEKAEPSTYEGIIDKKILGKYQPYSIEISNKSDETVSLPGQIFYIGKNNAKYRTPDSRLLFEKTKRHTVRRAVIWGIAGAGIFSPFVIGASVGHSSLTNSKLKDNIERNNYRPYNLFKGDSYLTYIFIPDKEKPKKIIVKCVNQADEENFELEYSFKTDDIKSEKQ